MEGSRLSRSLLSLTAANAFTIVIAWTESWNLAPLMWIYWGQSIIIGIFAFLKILNLKEFSTEGFRMNNRPVDPTPGTRRQVAFFFLFHYGFFHLVYYLFLVMERPVDGAGGRGWVFLCVAAFFLNHFYSFVYNRERDSAKKPNIGTMMFFPYARIVPLHLTIIGGSLLATTGATAPLLFFLALKTGADLVMHVIEHREPAVGY